jgi:transcription elongation factor/antiterminator RfaH
MVCVTTSESTNEPGQGAAGAEYDRWYAVYTLPLSEKRAQVQLENQQYRTFLPQRQKTVRHARRLTTVTTPYFPRYMFVSFDPARERWRAINGTRGVATLVMQGDQPQPIPRGIVEGLLAATDDQGLLNLQRHLRVGCPVRMAAGPFAEKLGILDYLDDSGRVRVLLDLLGQKVTVSMRYGNLLPANP